MPPCCCDLRTQNCHRPPAQAECVAAHTTKHFQVNKGETCHEHPGCTAEVSFRSEAAADLKCGGGELGSNPCMRIMQHGTRQ